MKITLKTLFLTGMLAASGFFFNACSENAGERNVADSTSAYIHENTHIVGFGHVDAVSILNKMDYQQIPQLNAILGSILEQWKKGFDLKQPLYYAVEAPFDQQGNPAKLVTFIQVKNSDSLKAVINEMQYSLEQAGDISYFQENDITFGFRNNLFILISKGGEYDGKAAIQEAFKQTEGDLSEGKTADILAQTGDIIAGINVERLLLTSNTELNKIPDEQLKTLKGLVADAFIQTNIHFTDGELRIESKNLFSEALKDQLPFEDNNGNTLIKKLHGGAAWFGMSYNLNLRKGEEFLHNFLPFANEKINDKIPAMVRIGFLSLGENPYSKLFSGQLGMVATGNAKIETGMPLEMNSFIGLGAKGNYISDLIREQMDGLPAKGNTYILNGNTVTLAKDGIYYQSGSPSTAPLKLPAYAKDFGTKSFTCFVAFDKMNVKSFELEDAAKVIEILEYATVTADKDGTTVIIAAKNKKANILKLASDFYLKELMNKLNS